jgi:CubicO group peptidase (beta-lactamase class C family)/pimeloyl-ACP methyl ester carboxylesterase
MTLRIALLIVATGVASCQFPVAEAAPRATQPSGNGQPATGNIFTPHEFKAPDGTIVPAELGEFLVPENRTRPDSRKIAIRFVRFKSTAAKPGAPIVYLAGGPGGSGIGTASGSRFPLFMALREFGDVIAYDQRGTNQSGPKMTCSEEYMIDPGKPLERAGIAPMTEAVRRCAERLRKEGVDISGYNTIENAADLNDLRKALGVPKLVLWGISYGTHLAAATLRYHPDAVERVILAGIEGPDDTYKLPSDQETLLEEIARLAPLPDFLGSLNKLLRELEQSPKSVLLTHPETGQTATVVLGKLDLQRAIADMLFAPASFAGLPEFIQRLERGDWMALGLEIAPTRFGKAPSVMSVAMDCASGITAARRQRIAEEVPRTHLGDAINLPFPEVCAAVNVPDAGDAFRAPLRSGVPALLISGTLDGRTRPRQAEELRMTMPNAEHLVLVGAGHSDPLFLSSPKILEAMKAFLRGEPLRERYIEVALPQFKSSSVPQSASVPRSSSEFLGKTPEEPRNRGTRGTAFVSELPAYEQYVEQWMREQNVPGLTIGFSKGDFTWVKAFGVADVENGTPMKTESSFRLASVQKSMTAVAVLQLVEEGKLDLDAEIQTYVPQYPKKAHPVTVRQLLSHLGGVPHYVNRAVEQHIKEHKTTRETIDIFAGFDLVAEPGTRFSYSTYGYNLLGAAIESVTGMPYGEYMTKKVWLPAGMTGTRMDDPATLIPNRVRGYRLAEGKLVNSEFIDISTRFAGGGTRGTVVDLLRFMKALNEGKLLSAESRRLMYTPARTRSGEEILYSMGWQIPERADRGALVMNDGGQQETRTNIINDPATGFSMALAMNLEADIYGPIHFRLYELVEGRPLR